MLSEINDIIVKSPSIELEAVSQRKNYRMKAFIITMINDHESTVGARRVMQSISVTDSRLDAFIYPAVTPKTLDSTMAAYFGRSTLPNIKYTYPKTDAENRYDIKSGLQLNAYKTEVIEKRISCFMSHYVLWNECYQLGSPIVILEHDAVFTKTFRSKLIMDTMRGDIVGLNDPRGATRKATLYDKKVKEQWDKKYGKSKAPPYADYFEAPWIDDAMIPQGIGGNSAYIITPAGAAKLIQLTAEHGIWPNDAIMCKQLMPGSLYQAYPYITKVHPMKSTTSL